MVRVTLTDVSRETWLAMRRQYVNASETPIVCGESHWGSLAALYAEKKGLRPPLEDSDVLRRGRWGEAAVFEALAEERPEWRIERAKIYVIDENKRQACTPDGFAIAPDRDGIGIVQAKVVSSWVFRNKWLEDPDDMDSARPPAPYRLQTVQEMRLNGLSWGVIAVLINGEFDWRFRLFDLERNEEIEARIDYHTERFFREWFDPGIMPPFEPQRDAELVKELYPQDTGAVLDLAGDNRALALVQDLDEVSKAKKRAIEQEKIIKAELEAKLAYASYGKLGNGRWLQWKVENRRAYTVPASSPRVLRILANPPKGLQP